MNNSDLKSKEKGRIVPEVTIKHINNLVSQLKYHTYVIPNTTTTVCVAMLGDFTVAIGQTTGAGRENFDADFSAEIAKDDAEQEAWDELWKLESYRLKFKEVLE